MNTGQLMLTVGALTLLSVITLNYFATLGQSGANLVQSNTGLTATTIATSFIERAQNVDFDEDENQPFNLILANPALLTPVHKDSLTIDDPNEAFLDSLDDFDDFNFFNKDNPLVYSPEGINEKYHVEFKVYYVDTSNINASSGVGYQTFLKKMDVKVYRVEPPMQDSGEVNLSAIYGLFKFE